MKTLDYAIRILQEDIGALNNKNNGCCKEIDKVASEQKTLFEIIGHLETHIKELEGIINMQKHGIAHLRRNVETLDGNICQCCDCLLSPLPHGLSDEEGLEYLTDSEYQEAPMAPENPSPSPPPPTTPLSNLEDFGNPCSSFSTLIRTRVKQPALEMT